MSSLVGVGNSDVTYDDKNSVHTVPSRTRIKTRTYATHVLEVKYIPMVCEYGMNHTTHIYHTKYTLYTTHYIYPYILYIS
jgi:hypothetical protein